MAGSEKRTDSAGDVETKVGFAVWSLVLSDEIIQTTRGTGLSMKQRNSTDLNDFGLDYSGQQPVIEY